MFEKEKLYLKKGYWNYTLSWKRFADIFLLGLFIFIANDWYCFGNKYEIFKGLGIGILIFILTMVLSAFTGWMFYNPFNIYPLFGLFIIFGYDIYCKQIWVPILILLLSGVNLLSLIPIEDYEKSRRKEQRLYILFSLLFLVLKVCGITIIIKEILGFLFLISFLLPWSAYYPFVYCMEPGLYYDFHYEEASIREFLAPIVYWMIYLGFLDSIWYYVSLLI